MINLGLKHYMHMDCKLYASWKIMILDESIMVMLKMRLENSKATNRSEADANVTSPVGDENNGITVLK